MHRMKAFLAYPWALLYGLYFYVLFQIVFLIRFGHVNGGVGMGEIALYAVGLGSVLFCQWLTKKHPGHELAMTVAFVLATPFAFFGALLGGLFGALGVFLLGIIPFLVILSLGYVLIRWFTR